MYFSETLFCVRIVIELAGRPFILKVYPKNCSVFLQEVESILLLRYSSQNIILKNVSTREKSAKRQKINRNYILCNFFLSEKFPA